MIFRYLCYLLFECSPGDSVMSFKEFKLFEKLRSLRGGFRC